MLSLSGQFSYVNRKSFTSMSIRYVRLSPQNNQCNVLKCRVLAQQGFGATNAKSNKKSIQGKKGGKGLSDNWAKTCNISDFQEGKMTKAVEIKSIGKNLIVYKIGDDIYCSDASSTAFQYPLGHATIIQGCEVVSTRWSCKRFSGKIKEQC
eukprot:TRINITY_DN6382_c0_g1_i3.p2 TRINITY_DN6382_c0_g1~~TRINITY_DN6382_c0_g1_i3.p2  ORF type:complete len:151 (+),score=4.06 TRINITY_DN6382_c0_g1_i3:157-609(+)